MARQSEVGHLEEALAKLQTAQPLPEPQRHSAPLIQLVVDADVLVAQLPVLERVVSAGVAIVHVPAGGTLAGPHMMRPAPRRTRRLY